MAAERSAPSAINCDLGFERGKRRLSVLRAPLYKLHAKPGMQYVLTRFFSADPKWQLWRWRGLACHPHTQGGAAPQLPALVCPAPLPPCQLRNWPHGLPQSEAETKHGTAMQMHTRTSAWEHRKEEWLKLSSVKRPSITQQTKSGYCFHDWAILHEYFKHSLGLPNFVTISAVSFPYFSWRLFSWDLENMYSISRSQIHIYYLVCSIGF